MHESRNLPGFRFGLGLSVLLALSGWGLGAHSAQLDIRSSAPRPVGALPLSQRQLEIVASDRKSGDQFGARVAISGNTAVVGANRDAVNGKTDQGAVYVFVRDGANWVQQSRLIASDGVAGDQFGAAVAIDGNTVVIGARFADSNYGKAYVFTRSGSPAVWTEQKLARNLFPGSSAFPGFFGYAVGISGNTVVVGNPRAHGTNNVPTGIAHVFALNGTTWTLQTQFSGSSGTGLFGQAVAISSGSIIVGDPSAFFDTPNDPNHPFGVVKGAAYVFTGSDANWSLQQQLAAPDGEQDDFFGQAVAIDGDSAIVGAPGDDVNGRVDQGSMSIWVRSNNVWSQQFAISGTDSAPGDNFGSDVAIRGNTAVVGAIFHAVNSNTNQGTAYVFSRNANLWSQTDELLANDGAAGDRFGVAVALTERTTIVGAFGSQGLAGAAYIFEPLDSDGDGLPDDWEINGITIDANGVISVGNTGNGVFIDLPKMGADPMHQDIFVHLDWMQPGPNGQVFKPDPRAIQMVIDSFAIAPRTNPDHKMGVNLHVDFGPDSVMNPATGEKWGALSEAGEVTFQELFDTASSPDGQTFADAFVPVKQYHFTPAKRRPVFHYALFCKNVNSKFPGGLGFVSATDFVVASSNLGNTIVEAGTFMHELGHNLGLNHGGGDKVNAKPNYISIMNYKFQNTGTLKVTGQRSIDYSADELPTLDERNLNESLGIADPLRHLTTWNKFTRSDVPAGSNQCAENPNSYFDLFSPGSELDWNCNGAKDFTPVTVDINGDGLCVLPNPDSGLHTTPAGDDQVIEVPIFGQRRQIIVSGPNRTCETTADPLDTQKSPPGFHEEDLLTGFNDWAALVFDGNGVIGTSASTNTLGVRTVVRRDSLPVELPSEFTFEQVNADVPPVLLEEELSAPLDVATSSPVNGSSSVFSFDGSGSTAVTGTIVSYAWDFGDGTTGTGATTTHTYSAPGVYFATLTVTDSNGHVNLIPLLQRITVTSVPTPTPTPTPAPTPTPIPTPTPVPTPTPIPTPTPTATPTPTPIPTPTPVPTPPGPGAVDIGFKAAVTRYGGHTISAIVTQPDGKIIVGGEFDSFAGCARRGIVRINANGTCDPTFDPGLLLTDLFDESQQDSTKFRRSLLVQALVLQPDGKILVGVLGERGLKDGVSRASQGILRLNPDGTRDTSFEASSDFVDSYLGDDGVTTVRPSVQVQAIALQPDGKIVIGGSFTYSNNGRRADIARLNATGSVDASFVGGLGYFQPTRDFQHDDYHAFALQPDGKIIVGGLFLGVGGGPILRINADGSLDGTFNSQNQFGAFSGITALALQPDGKVIVSGNLRSLDGSPAVSMARLNSNGSRDNFANSAFSYVGPVRGLALQSDGKVIAVGDFELGGNPATSADVARLNADGTLDPSYNVGTGTLNPDRQLGGGSVSAIALQANGKAVFGGEFSHFNDARAESIMQLNPDGSRDQTFESNGPGFNNEVLALVRQPDGKLLVGFLNTLSASDDRTGDSPRSKLNSTRIGGIGRLNSDGATDTTFTSPFDVASNVQYVALQSDGKIIVGGSFVLIGDSNGNTIYFTRLNADGTLDTTFHPPPGFGGKAVMQTDGKILTAGTSASGTPGLVRLNTDGSRDDTFSTVFYPKGVAPMVIQPDGSILILYNYAPIPHLGRLNGDGTLDSTFNPGMGPDDLIRALLLQPDGKILIGGDFFNYNGAARDCIALLNADGSLNTSFLPVNPNTYHTFGSSQNYPQKVGALALQPDGKIFVGSYYRSNVAFSIPNRVFRLNPDGSLDDSFPLGTGLEGTRLNVDTMLLQPDGNILIGGEFNVVNGVAALGLARIIGTPPTFLANISTRLRVEAGDNALIAGFIITGTGQKRVLLRAIGPSLPIDGHLNDPVLELHAANGQTIALNDNWNDASNRQEIIDSTIPPANDLESAILTNLNPGAYTAIMRGVNDTTGIGVVEAYDLDSAAGSKLANISTRGLVQTGDNVLIAGTIVVGQSSQKVIMRAIGPSLSVPGKLADPTLELHDGNGTLLEANDNWVDSPNKQAIIDSTIPPTNDSESAIVRTLAPGNYTAIVRGVNNTTGVAVVEVFALN